MYQIQLSSIRADLVTQKAIADNDVYKANWWLGGSQDAATAFAMAADADALASRLMDCAEARLAFARGAVWGLNPDAIYFNPPAALNQSVRALMLIEKAGEAKQFSERMLDAALIFESAALSGEGLLGQGEMNDAAYARMTWSNLMADGIFSREMYELPQLTDDF